MYFGLDESSMLDNSIENRSNATYWNSDNHHTLDKAKYKYRMNTLLQLR